MPLRQGGWCGSHSEERAQLPESTFPLLQSSEQSAMPVLRGGDESAASRGPLRPTPDRGAEARPVLAEGAPAPDHPDRHNQHYILMRCRMCHKMMERYRRARTAQPPIDEDRSMGHSREADYEWLED